MFLVRDFGNFFECKQDLTDSGVLLLLYQQLTVVLYVEEGVNVGCGRDDAETHTIDHHAPKSVELQHYA